MPYKRGNIVPKILLPIVIPGCAHFCESKMFSYNQENVLLSFLEGKFYLCIRPDLLQVASFFKDQQKCFFLVGDKRCLHWLRLL